MNTEKRQTHMWQAIARRAFAPQGPEPQARWLRCFSQSVFQYVDNPDAPRCPSPTPTGWQGSFGSRSLLLCKYVIGPERSQFDLLRPDWHAQYGIDTTVFAPCHVGGEEVDEAASGDTEAVLRGMIDHPRAHLHVFDDTACHEVRIGTGISEPFLFLFQLRFQLCLDPERRRTELARLATIFTPAWFHRRDPVAPPHLFGLPNS